MASEVSVRDNRIEVFRCLMMFGICLLHAITQGGHIMRWADNALHTCVVGFVVISGWFGIKFSWGKVFRIVALTAWCALVVSTMFLLRDQDPSWGVWWHRVMYSFKSWWFVWAYVFLMMLAPLVNSAVASLGKDVNTNRDVLIPFVALVFGWGYLSMLPGVMNYVPITAGLTAHSGITLLGVYVIARVVRMQGLLEKISQRIWLLIAAAMLVVTTAGFYKYNSPFSLVQALAWFALIKGARIPRWVCGSAAFFAPSMFAVYMYHSSRDGLSFLRTVESGLIDEMGLNTVVCHIVVAVGIFAFGVLLDMPRRFFLWCVMRWR